MKKALFIAYYFPPSGGGGVKRPTKFVKYLSKYNWQSVVLTAPENSYTLRDNKFIHELPNDLKIIRVRPLISKKKADQFRKDSLKGIVANSENIKGIRNKVLWKLKEWLMIPDVQVTWIPFALPRALRAIRKYKIRVIWTKCPPYSMLVLGALLKMLSGRPWVIDLSDPWTIASYNYFPNRHIKKINAIIEKILFRYADKIVTVAENIVEDYCRTYPVIPKEKYNVITNGFDPDDLENVETFEQKKFTICYTGRVDLGNRDPVNFFKALNHLIGERPEVKEHLQVLFVGGGGDYWQATVNEYNLRGIVKFIGNVSHEESIKYQFSSHLLLLIGTGSKYEQTGKIFEYLVAEKPILCLLSRETPAAEIVKKTNTGSIVSNDHIDDISVTIYNFYLKFKKHIPLGELRDKNEIMKYNWIYHAENLGRIFDSVTAKNNIEY